MSHESHAFIEIRAEFTSVEGIRLVATLEEEGGGGEEIRLVRWITKSMDREIKNGWTELWEMTNTLGVTTDGTIFTDSSLSTGQLYGAPVKLEDIPERVDPNIDIEPGYLPGDWGLVRSLLESPEAVSFIRENARVNDPGYRDREGNLKIDWHTPDAA